MHGSYKRYVVLLMLVALATVTAIAQATDTASRGAVELLDEGLLDPSWFSDSEELTFRRTRVFDYFWVAEGLNLEGRRLRINDWEPATLPAERRQRDIDREAEVRPLMTEQFLDALKRVLKDDSRYSRTEGDVQVFARFVDLSASKATSWKVGYFTYDLKLVDAESGDLLVAVHHRMIGNPKPKMKHWFRAFAQMIQGDLRTEYLAAKLAVGPP